MSRPKKLRLVASGADQPLNEARYALEDTVEDLFELVKLYGAAGDHEMARSIAKHAHGLAALRIMSRS